MNLTPRIPAVLAVVAIFLQLRRPKIQHRDDDMEVWAMIDRLDSKGVENPSGGGGNSRLDHHLDFGLLDRGRNKRRACVTRAIAFALCAAESLALHGAESVALGVDWRAPGGLARGRAA